MPERHTPEPWESVEVFGVLPYVVNSGLREVVAERVFNGNQRRIVACVNALQGVPIEAVEGGVLSALFQSALLIAIQIEGDPKHASTPAAKALRDALLMANPTCRAVRDLHQHTDSTGQPIKVGDRVRWSGKVYTIKAFVPTANPLLCRLEFTEPRHREDCVCDEVSVDLVD